MTIPEIPVLKAEARSALEYSRNQKNIALVYTAGLVGSSLVVLVLDYILSQMIADAGGLGNLGTRTILSSLQSMLPILQMLVLLGWNAGYALAVLQMIRRQNPDRTALTSGFSMFFPMLRCMLLEGMIYFNIIILSFLLSAQIYAFTPWARELMQLLEPVLPAMLENPEAYVLEDALLLPALRKMLPLMGFVLPFGFDATYYLCYGVYLAIVFGLYALVRNRVECTYVAAYEALREKPKENAVVLGNIFDM